MTNTVKAKDGKTYALPKKPVWRKGPPPEIGWWPADYEGAQNSPECLRYWGGEIWSTFCYPDENGADGSISLRKGLSIKVTWTDRWWLNQPKGFPK